MSLSLVARAGFKRPRAGCATGFSQQSISCSPVRHRRWHPPSVRFRSIDLEQRQIFVPSYQVRCHTSLREISGQHDYVNMVHHLSFSNQPSLRHLSNAPPRTSTKAKAKPRHPNQNFQPRNPRNKQNPKLSPEQIQNQLMHRLQFFFSDTNLRHDSYARSMLVEQKYLPLSTLMSFNSIKRLTNDVEVIVETSESLELEVKYINEQDGDILIGRSDPFNFQESMEQCAKKILIVSGWPVEINTRWVEDRFRSLLEACYVEESSEVVDQAAAKVVDKATKAKAALMSIGAEPAIIYWGKNVADGVITIEFRNEATANKAWETLQSMTQYDELSPGEVPHPSELICDFQSDRNALLYVGDLELSVRGIDFETKPTAAAATVDDEVDKAIQVLEELKAKAKEEQSEQKPIGMAEEATSDDVSTSKTKKRKWWTNKQAAPSLSRCIKTIDELYTHHLTLPPPPREWLHESRFNKRMSRKHIHLTEDELDQRRELCADVAQIIGCVHNSIAKGVIRALGTRDAFAMADFLNRVMLILSESPPKKRERLGLEDETTAESLENNVSPYEACLDALNILRSLNLDVHPHHYSYAIRSACHEFRWEEAANTFLRQIEGNDGAHDVTGGFVPLDSTLGWDQPLEVGLYAVAVDALRPKLPLSADIENENAQTYPSMKVFDTAMKMSMIAPSGQESYVLAAGSALGRAGLWSDCLDFATDPHNISKYGPSIAAAAMLACIESHRSAEAIELYNFFFNSENQSTASEWQWAGGNLSAAKPLFDDLLLRAYGGPSSGGYSAAAIAKFCNMVDSNAPFSSHALVGLMQSIEYDADWQSAIKLLETFCDVHYHNKQKQWLLVNEMLSLSGIDEVDDSMTLTQSELDDLTAKLLASTMRTCNKEGFFSLSLLLSSITHSFVGEGLSRDLMSPDDESTIKAITSQSLLNNKSVRDAYFHSLSKVGLKRLVRLIPSNTNSTNHAVKNKLYPPAGEAMLNAFITANRILIALDDISHSKKPISLEDKRLILRGLSSAMGFYLDANHPASAMHLFSYASKIMEGKKKDAKREGLTSFAETMSNFFGDDRADPTTAAIFQSDDLHDCKSLCTNDSLLSAVMRAYTMMGQPEKALALLKDVQGETDTASWDTIQSFNQALEVLLESDVAEFMSFFEDSNSGLVMPSTFLLLARKYAKEGLWPEIGELYNEARRRGCISEELGFIAMQAVCEAQLDDGKILVLRKISDDISNTVGMKTQDWLNSQYWHIKRYTGFHYARMLMKWNTPATSQKEELLFAINEMRHSRQQGVLTKNAPLFCIAKQGELYESDGGYKGSRLNEKQRRSAINIIFEACAEAQLSGLMKRPAFTAEVVRSLFALNADKQCIQFVKTLMTDGEKCRHRVAMEYAIRAASENKDNESLEVLINAYENSGFNLETITA